MSDDNRKPVACVQCCFLCRDHNEGKEILPKANSGGLQANKSEGKVQGPQIPRDIRLKGKSWSGQATKQIKTEPIVENYFLLNEITF